MQVIEKFHVEVLMGQQKYCKQNEQKIENCTYSQTFET